MTKMRYNLYATILILCTATGQPHKFSLWAPNATSVEVLPAVAPGNAPPSWHTTHLNLTDNGSNRSGKWWWSGTVEGVVAGDGYLFRINENDKFLAIDPRGRDIAMDSSCSVVSASYTFKNARHTVTKPYAVYYELLVGVFTPEGTLEAAAEKLEYLRDLGITVIELMPVMHSCSSFRDWGYCPRAPYAVRPELGGSLGLKRFVDAAAGYNMAVALDVVYNHASANSLLKHFGNWLPSNDGNGLYFYQGEYSRTKWGPRPSYLPGEQQDYIVDNVAMLIEEYHISSFRWDSTVCIRKGGADGRDNTCSTDNPDGWNMMQRANNLDPAVLQVCEDTWGTPYNESAMTAATNDTSAHGPVGTIGGGGFDMAWGYPWHTSVMQELVKNNTRLQRYPLNVNILMNHCASMTADKFVIFTENHDVSSNQNRGRVPFMVDPTRSDTFLAQKKAMLGIGMLLCRGTPMLLMGQELLTYANFTFPSPPFMNWTAVSRGDPHQSGMLAATRDMLRLRTNHDGHSHGLLGGKARVIQTDYNASIGVVHRWSSALGPFPLGASNDVLLVFNFGRSIAKDYKVSGLPYNGKWSVRFNGDSFLYSPLFSDECSQQTFIDVQNTESSICIPALTMLVLTRDNSK